MEPVLIFGIPLLAGVGLSILLTRRRAEWSRKRIALTGALPLPLLGLSYCTLVFFDAWTTPQDRCGTDACAMAMAGSFTLGGVLVIVYVASAGVSALLLLAMGR